ncbi:MAG: hypothetical protein ACI33J_08945 [Clostridium sp.]
MGKLFDIKVEESISICNKWIYTNSQFPCSDDPSHGQKEPPCWEYATNPGNS